MSKETDILEHSARNGFNVLLVGRHGVGKTAMVKEVFEKIGWNWKYFSASTIDPWVDLVGVPKEVNGVLELIRPADLAFDEVEAFFFDEYNRAPKKVRNAVMEVIQFGSINGKKFPNLKVVFAAINPDDDEELSYDVEKLDPAQIDRFHIHLPVKNVPCAYFFKKVYANIGSLAVKWWQEQTKEIKDLISPRRLEAGVRVFLAHGDPQYVFDADKVNVGEFVEYLDRPDPIELLDKACGMSDVDKAAFLRDNNQLKHIRKDLLGKERYLKELAHHLPDPEIMKELRNAKGNKVISHVAANVSRFEHLVDVVLSNKNAYSGKIVDAFSAYRKSKGATSSPASLNRKVTIRGKEITVTSMTICFSGRLSGFSRQQATDYVETYGAKTVASITSDTTHLVTGEKTGEKVRKAKSQGVQIITEDEFYKMIQELNSPAAMLQSTQAPASSKRWINNVLVNIDELTLDNYKEKTGQRFRMEKWDTQNGLSREEAFEATIKRLRDMSTVEAPR